CVDLPMFGFVKLFRTRKGRCTNESSLRLSSSIGGHYFCDAVVDYFNQNFTAWGRLDHQIGWLEVAMYDATTFRCGQSSRCLLNDFKRERQRQRPITLHTRFERFAFHKFHCIETFAVLLTVVRYTGYVRMMNFGGCTCFAQKTRTSSWIFCEFPTDDLQRDSRIKNCVSSAVSYRHCSGAKY